MRGTIVGVTMAFAVLAAASAGAAGQGVRDLDGRPVDPLAERDQVTVLLFLRTDCPISNRYAPEVRRIHEAFAARGVMFWLVFAGVGQEADAVRRHLADFDYPGRVALDPAQQLVRKTGATVTPEAAVLDPRGRLVYRGRIDDRYVELGVARRAPTTHDLRNAIDATLAGAPVVPSTTRAVGCLLRDLEGSH